MQAQRSDWMRDTDSETGWRTHAAWPWRMGGVGDDAYHDAKRGRDITVDIHCVLELTDFK